MLIIITLVLGFTFLCESSRYRFVMKNTCKNEDHRAASLMMMCLTFAEICPTIDSKGI